MLPISPRHIRIASFGILIGGGAYAANVMRAPAPKVGVDTRQVRQLAERLDEMKLTPPPALQDAETPAPAAPVKPVTPAVRKTLAPAPVKPAPEPVKPVVTAPVVAAPVVRRDPLREIALIGITHEGGTDSAWLLDLENKEREVAAQGTSAFGFTVKAVNADSVVLSQAGEDYTLSLGEKPVLLASASVDSLSLSDGEDDGGGGGPGRGGRGARGQGAGGFGARGGRGGRGAGGFGGGLSAATFGGGNNNFGGGNFGGGGGNFGGGGRFGGNAGRFGGGGFTGGGGNFGGGNSGNGNSQFSASATGSTSNPQTARRRGTQLVGAAVGGATAMSAPPALDNPQTDRRKGTTGSSTGTPAFGSGTGNTAAATRKSGTSTSVNGR